MYVCQKKYQQHCNIWHNIKKFLEDKRKYPTEKNIKKTLRKMNMKT